MPLVPGDNKGGQIVWQNEDGTIVPVRLMLDGDGNLVPVPTGPGATEEKQDNIILQQIDGSQLTSLVDPINAARKNEFDTKFKVPIFQDIEHSEIHESCSFERHISSSNAEVVTLNVAFKTLNSDKLAHMLPGFSSNDEILFEIIEGPTWTQGSGTELDIINVNRDIGGNSIVMMENKNQETFIAANKLIKDVTNVSGGINIDPDRYTYNASLGSSVIAESREAVHEWVLKRDTAYVIRMTKTDANCKMNIDLHWYEHTNE